MTLVETLISMTLVAVVILGGLAGLNYIQSTTGQQRNRIEASGLATKYEELFQADASQNSGSVTPGTYNYSDTIANTTFQSRVSFSLDSSNGVNPPSSLCVSSTNSETGELWAITVKVTWHNMQGSPPVVQTTDIAPGQAGANALSNGTIAAEIIGLDSAPLTQDASGNPVSINWVLSEVKVGSGTSPQPPLPNNGQTNYTTTDGCAVATNLVANPNWDYVVTLAGNPGWVDPQEQSDTNLPDPATAALAVYPGEVTKLQVPLQLAQGQNETFTLQPVTYSCGKTITSACYTSSFTPAANIPISVGNPFFSSTGGSYTFGVGGPTPTSELLYPFTNGYSVYAGDGGEASQSYSGYSTQASPQINPTAGGTGQAAVPVYRLSLQNSPSSPVATPISGAVLNYGLTSTGGSSYAAGLPLGEYQLTGGGSMTNPYVWLTPSGVYYSSSLMAVPTDGTLASGSVSE
ncbi:MAG: type IV pilus modification PilV family protein [Acidimicrobiales bacterium]